MRDNLQVVDDLDLQQSLENFGKLLVPILDGLEIKAQPEVHQAYEIIEG